MSTPEYDEDADFALGFDSTEPEPTALPTGQAPASDPFADFDEPEQPVAPVVPAADAGADASEPASEEADPFAGMPDAVRKLLANVPRLEAEVQTLRRTAGMVPALQSKLDKLERERAAPPQSEATPAPPRREKVEQLRAIGMDDTADALEELHQLLDQRTAAAPAPEPTPAAAPAAPDAPVDPVFASLDAVRPTWGTDLSSDDFELWLAQQAKDYQVEVRSTNDPGVILSALGKFDKRPARPAPQPPAPQPPSSGRSTQRMAAALTPRGDGRVTRVPTSQDDEDDGMQAGFYGGR